MTKLEQKLTKLEQKLAKMGTAPLTLGYFLFFTLTITAIISILVGLLWIIIASSIPKTFILIGFGVCAVLCLCYGLAKDRIKELK